MSRVGLRPIPVPAGVKVNIDGNAVTVEGGKGKLSRTFHTDMTIKLEGDTLLVSRPSDDRIHRSLHGLTRSLLSNMVVGVTEGFEKVLELSGVGYRAQKTDKGIQLQVGFCHPVDYVPPSGITLVVEGNNRIRVQGIDREVVGETAAQIRAIRPPDSYKGKGVRYLGEKLRLKAGKGIKQR
jgi:large subunit ribosomal protein L6